MTVTVNVELSTALVVPFRGTSKVTDPTHSVSMLLQATGDASGGLVNVNVLANREEFGMRPLLVLTLVEMKDNLAATSDRMLQYSSVGNGRITSGLTIPKVPVPHRSDFIAVYSGSELAVMIEPDGLGLRTLFTMQWETNTDTKLYTVNLFGLLWDAEALARMVGAQMPGIYYGVR